MRHCTFCGTGLPEQAQFCGYCGRLSTRAGERPLEGVVPSSTWSEQDNPTVISNTSLPTMINEQTLLHPQQEERTLLTPHNNATWTPPISSLSSDEEEQDRMRRAMVWGVPLVGADMPGPSGTPVVQGTPQVNSAPSIPGTPQLLIAGQTQYTPPPYQRTTQFDRQNRRVRTRTVSSAGARAAKGAATQWIIVVVTAVLVLTTAGVGVALAVSPSLSLSGGVNGNRAVVPGQRLSLHGSGFLPGGHITLKRDSGQTVQVAAQKSAMATGKPVSPAMIALSALSLAASTDGPVIVNAAGTFDASMLIGKDWGSGEHTIRATEDIFSRGATMVVNVDDAPSALSVSSTNLDFGSMQKGTKTTLSLAIGNTGGKPLTWTAATSGAKWLQLQSTSGEVLPDGGPQSLTVSCDTTSLALGTYSATIHLHTDGGNSNVKVALRVVPQKQAQLAVSTAMLDFQTMDVGQQATKVISITNTGVLKLDWQVTGNENWISLTPASGSIQPGGTAQRVDVQVDTTGLQAGSYSATLTVGSNGGASQVAVFLLIAAPLPPTPTPTSAPPTPTQVLPTLTPTQVPQGSICQLPASLDFGTVSQGQTAIQPLTLGNCGGASFTWRAQRADAWVAVDNSGSTLDPGTTTTIKVTVDTTALGGPGTYKSTITFYTSVGNQVVNITVKVPKAMLIVTPTSTSEQTVTTGGAAFTTPR